MRWATLVVALGLCTALASSGCVQTENSNSQDAETYGNVGGTLAFLNARTIITNRCVSCHPGWAGYTEAQYISNGLVVPNNAEASKLYYRLSGSSGSQGPKDMPQNGALDSNDVDSIAYWINNI